MTSGKTIAATDICALIFGFFLGLCILKFGDPVILDQKIFPPTSLSEFLSDSWPTHWANWMFFPLAAIVAIVAFLNGDGRTQTKTEPSRDKSSPAKRRSSPSLPGGLVFLPLLWLGWQFISATRTVEPTLTATTLWQFCGCVACFLLGALVFNTAR